jgi:hypothetical protein
MKTKYNLKQDHQAIKEQIKEWEIVTSYIIECLNSIPNRKVNEDGEGKAVKLYDIIRDLEDINNEMLSINL